jgi:peroxiredoxin
MVELAQLEEHHEEFASRHVKLVAASPDSAEETASLQQRFPHVTLVSDAEHHLAQAAQVLGPHHGPDGKPTNAPTTVFLDQEGKVRWVFRPDRYITRLSALEALLKVDDSLAGR